MTEGIPLKNESLKSYWDKAWDGNTPQLYAGPVYEAHSILKKFLPVDSSFRCLEIGCVPGNWLVYLHREFGYVPYGIDNSEATSLAEATLRLNQITGTIWRGDAFNFPYSPAQFDVVYSGGFVEHFDDYRGTIDMHKRLVKDGGYLVISVPNLCGIHGILMKVVDRPQYDTHRLELMKKGRVAELVNGDFEVIFSGYCTTYRPFYALPEPLNFMSRCVVKALNFTRLQQIPNRWFSPHQWMIAKKRNSNPLTPIRS